MAISPVASATRFMLLLNEPTSVADIKMCRKEGLKEHQTLVEWIQSPDRPDYHEAAMLTFFLARTMKQHRIITAKRFHKITDQAATVIQQVCASKMDRAMAEYLKDRGYTCQETAEVQEACPATEAVTRIATLKPDDTPSSQDKKELLELFERLVHWASVTEQTSFYEESRATYVFSIGDHMLDKGLITPGEKQFMDQRAFQVFVRHPDHNIQDDDLVDFLHINLQLKITKIKVKTSPVQEAETFLRDLDQHSSFALKDPRFRKEGLKHHAKLVQWLSRINRDDYQRAAEQTFVLLDVMKDKKIVSEHRYAKLDKKTRRTILATLGTKISEAMTSILLKRSESL